MIIDNVHSILKRHKIGKD